MILFSFVGGTVFCFTCFKICWFDDLNRLMQASEGKSIYTGAYKKYASRKRFYGLSENQKFSSVNLSKLIEVRPSSIC